MVDKFNRQYLVETLPILIIGPIVFVVLLGWISLIFYLLTVPPTIFYLSYRLNKYEREWSKRIGGN